MALSFETVTSAFAAAGLPGVALAFLAVILGFFYIRRTIWESKFKLPPGISGPIPFLGCGPRFGTDPLGLLFDGYTHHGEVFSLRLFGEIITMLAGPESQRYFFKMSDDVFSARHAYAFTVPVFGPNVVYDVKQSELIQQRQMVSGGLTLKQFKSYAPMIEAEARGFSNSNWGTSGSKTVEMMSNLNVLTTLTSTRCLQGDEIRGHMNADFTRLYEILDASLSPIGFFFPNLPIPAIRKSRKARGDMGRLFQSLIDKRRANPNDVRDDMLHTLMGSKSSDGVPLTDEQICGICVGLMLAGQHTSNMTTCWLMVFLAAHPECMAKAKAEQKKIFSNGDEELTYANLKAMNYLECVIKETLRLRPPIILILRRVMEDVQYQGFDLPKGTIVGVSPALSHRLPECWDKPDDFIPERFSAERAEDKATPFSYFAFGAGVHGCIGEGFAMVQIKAIMSYILRNYDWETLNKVEPDFTTLIAGPKKPVNMKVTYNPIL